MSKLDGPLLSLQITRIQWGQGSTTKKVKPRFVAYLLSVTLWRTTMHCSAQAALSAVAYDKIREGRTDQPYGFFLTREATKNKAGHVFHIIVSSGDPHNFGIKDTCGKKGFVANPGATVPNSLFCVKACENTDNNDDCLECQCAIMVAKEFNALPNFDTYTVSILKHDEKFESARLTMEVCQLYTAYY